MLSFVAEEDLRIETSCPLNEVTAVVMLNNFFEYLLLYVQNGKCVIIVSDLHLTL